MGSPKRRVWRFMLPLGCKLSALNPFFLLLFPSSWKLPVGKIVLLSITMNSSHVSVLEHVLPHLPPLCLVRLSMVSYRIQRSRSRPQEVGQAFSQCLLFRMVPRLRNILEVKIGVMNDGSATDRADM